MLKIVLLISSIIPVYSSTMGVNPDSAGAGAPTVSVTATEAAVIAAANIKSKTAKKNVYNRKKNKEKRRKADELKKINSDIKENQKAGNIVVDALGSGPGPSTLLQLDLMKKILLEQKSLVDKQAELVLGRSSTTSTAKKVAPKSELKASDKTS